jgi:hypothetical protein
MIKSALVVNRLHELRATRRAGQALVELSVIIFFVGGLFLVGFDFARAMNTYLVTVHAAREGARIAGYERACTTTVVSPCTGTTTVQSAALQAANDFTSVTVVCEMVNVNTANGTFTVGSACPNVRPVDSAFRITTSTTFQPIVPFIKFGVGAAGGYASGAIPISHQVLGLVMDEP